MYTVSSGGRTRVTARATSTASQDEAAALRQAIGDLRDSEQRLAAARARLEDPRLVMELERLVAERRNALDVLVRSLRRTALVPDGAATATSPAVLPEPTPNAGDEAILASLVRRETSAIGTLRETLQSDLPAPVAHAVRTALTQVGRSRDQLELVGP